MTAPRPRIALLTDQLDGGGAQRVAALIARSLHDIGEPTTLIAARGGALASELPDSLPIRILAPSWPSPSGVLTFLLNLRRTVKHGEVRVIVANGFTIGRLVLFARNVRWMSRLPVVVVEHSTLSMTLAARFPNRRVREAVRLVTGWLYRRADVIIGVSQGVCRDLEETLQLPENSVVKIYNPVDAHRIAASIEESPSRELAQFFQELPRPIVITTGRLVPAKGHRDLLTAFALLPNSYQGSLIILGEGPLRPAIQLQAKQLGIAGRVWMPGHIENPWWFIARSDLFALSSHWEGFGLVLVEALICGAPIVATDCPSGPREVLAGVASSRLTPVADPAGLADAIVTVLHANNDASQFDRAAEFDPRSAASNYLTVIANVLRASDRGSDSSSE